MEKEDKILILGSSGLVGSSLIRALKKEGYKTILAPTRSILDLTRQKDVLNYFFENKPLYVLNAAAKVGGIRANNQYRADFIFQNLSIQNNVFEAAFKSTVRRLLFMGSSCIYPKNCHSPIKEEYLLTGELEPTNEPFAIAKLAGLKTAESFKRQYGCDFFTVMPSNLYGPGDNFQSEDGHVIPGIIQRLKKTMDKGEKIFEVWGSGSPIRDFLYVDDLAKACIILMKTKKELPYLINIGAGDIITIKELAETICKLMGFTGQIIFNKNFPDGTLNKVLDLSKIKNFKWSPEINLKEGLKFTINYFLSNNAPVTSRPVEYKNP
jgi:GDP-L-fucose synthase